LVPQITGGTLEAGPVTEKVSVLHCVCSDTGTPPVVAVVPASVVVTDDVSVFGPAMTKVFMSIRSFSGKYFHGQYK
jgi:hypothetical protein